MDQESFLQVVDEYLVPMLQGTLAPGTVPSTPREGLTSYANLNQLKVKPTRDAGYRLVINRSPTFTDRERELAGQFISELAAVVKLNAGDYEPELIRAIPRRVVAAHLGGGTRLHSVLGWLETWSSQTYEGQRIVASIGLDAIPAQTSIALDELWEEPFGPVLTNGFDTLLVVGSDSEIRGVKQLYTPRVSRTAPYRLREVACWANRKRISVVLNQHGEILVFQNQSLRFARRSGNWLHYVHETNIRRMSPPKDRSLREAIYESCLDVSFARTGGCIGVVNQAQLDQVSEIVSGDDLLASLGSYKSRVISQVVGEQPFQSLDRRARSELLSLDGAMILDRDGRILCAGTIVNIPGGSVGGGGRTAAAVRLSTLGLGLKISQDGTITGFRKGSQILKS